jgi:hypothetical protein
VGREFWRWMLSGYGVPTFALLGALGLLDAGPTHEAAATVASVTADPERIDDCAPDVWEPDGERACQDEPPLRRRAIAVPVIQAERSPKPALASHPQPPG